MSTLNFYIDQAKINNRQAAISAMSDFGIPSKKMDKWNYTNPQSVLDFNYFAKNDDGLKDVIDLKYAKDFLFDGYRLVTINGRFSEQDSRLPKGLTISITREFQETKFENFLHAFNESGLLESIKLEFSEYQGKTYKLPIIHFFTKGTHASQVHLRINIELKKLETLKVIEVFSNIDNTTNTLVTSRTSLNALTGANLNYVALNRLNQLSSLFTQTSSAIDIDATIKTFHMLIGSKFNRSEIIANLNGENSHASMHGLFAGQNSQHIDATTELHHRVPHTSSAQTFKGILDDESNGVFFGLIKIYKDAQKSDAAQVNKNMLLSQKAHVQTRPQLEVDADDVKAAHGATTGQISEDELFYLESRGIAKSQARLMLSHAFAVDVINLIEDKEIEDMLTQQFMKEFETQSKGLKQ